MEFYSKWFSNLSRSKLVEENDIHREEEHYVLSKGKVYLKTYSLFGPKYTLIPSDKVPNEVMNYFNHKTKQAFSET